MNDRTVLGLAVVFSSATLVAILFAFAVFCGAFWGAATALLTALVVYLFQMLQYVEAARVQFHAEFYQPSTFTTLLFKAAFVTGTASAFLSIAGV